MMWIDKTKKYRITLDKWEIGLAIICLGFYLFFPFYDGPVWCADSPSYATMNITREPLYPTFLWIFRSLFGEDGYLMPVVLAQSLLAAYATWKLSVTVKRYKDNSRSLALLAVIFQFGVTILCRFVAIRGSSYIDSIMTEGLGLSLYVLFIVQLYRYMIEGKKRNLAAVACYALLLVNLRKQMLLTLALMAAVFFLYYILKKRRIKKILLLLGLTVSLFLASKLTDRIYNAFVRGAWIEHSGNSMGMLCTLIYTSGNNDISLFAESTEEDVVCILYEEILSQAKAQELHVTYAPRGWVDLSTHYADSYDAIGYGIINPVIQGYIAEHFDYSEIEAVMKYDEYCNRMTKVLLLQDKGDLTSVLAANIWKGFINSIARVNPYLNIYVLLAYGFYLFLYIISAFGRTGRQRKRWEDPDNTLTIAEIVLGGIIVNSFVVGVMIFTQPRYMIYNMGLFYLALSMLIYDLISRKIRKW